MAWVADELWKAASVCALLQISNRAKKLRRSTCCSTSKRMTPTLAKAVRGQIVEHSPPALVSAGLNST